MIVEQETVEAFRALMDVESRELKAFTIESVIERGIASLNGILEANPTALHQIVAAYRRSKDRLVALISVGNASHLDAAFRELAEGLRSAHLAGLSDKPVHARQGVDDGAA